MADSDVARDEHATKRGAKVLQHPGTSWGIVTYPQISSESFCVFCCQTHMSRNTSIYTWNLEHPVLNGCFSWMVNPIFA